MKSFKYSAIAAAVLVSSISQAEKLTLEEVVVTAQKRTESMQDVPVSVSALTGDDLSNTGFRDVGDIAAQVPSLMVTTNASPLNTSFRIRRIGNEGNIPTFEPDTALIIDGAFRSRSGLGLGDLVDVKSVEVLKGPQSTLYGKNAGAGVVSITTQGPTQDREGSVEASVGSDNLQAVKAAINVPVSDRLSTRLSVSATRRDPLVDNRNGEDFDNLDGKAVRGQLRFDATENLSARLILGHVKRNMNPMMGDTYSSPAQLALIQQAGGEIRNNNPEDRVVEQSDRTVFDQTASDGVLALEYNGEGFNLTSISSFEDYEADVRLNGVEQLPLNLVKFNDLQKGDSFSQEFRFASEDDATVTWLAGLFYFENTLARGDKGRPEFLLESDIEEYGDAVAEMVLGVPTPTDLPVLGVEGDRGDFYAVQDTSSLGIFGQATVPLSESVEFTAGLRYSYEEKDAKITQSNQTSVAGCVPPLNRNLICTLAPDGNNFADDDSWSAVTGNMNISYFMNDETMLYGLISKGFKAGGYSLQNGGATAEIRSFDEEDITNLELGWKTEVFDRRGRINGSIFHTEYEDFQNASYVGLVFAVNNAEKVTVDGIELDSTWLLSESLTMNLNLAYIDAKYDKYSGGQCFYGRTPDNALGQCDLSGDNLPYAPKLTGNVGLTWEQPLASGDLYARLDYRYMDKANYSSELDPRHEKSAYGVGNFRLGWRNASYDVSAWVKNVTDETYYAQIAPANVATAVDTAVGSSEGSFQTFVGEPQTFGATVRYFF